MKSRKEIKESSDVINLFMFAFHYATWRGRKFSFNFFFSLFLLFDDVGRSLYFFAMMALTEMLNELKQNGNGFRQRE